MTAERPNRPFDLIRIHQGAIGRDLGRISQTRLNGQNTNLSSDLPIRMGEETDMNRLLAHLEITTDPHFILASREEGEYVIGDITCTHAELRIEWNDNREKAGKPGIQMAIEFVSGIVFRLKTDPLTQYIRLDAESYYWQELPPYAIALIDSGYTVVDAVYKRVARDVDYNLIWDKRNDM